MNDLRREQREERRYQHHQCNWDIKERHHRKNQKGRQDRDGELRQILPEINLELLHALDHRHNGIAGTLKTKMGGAQTCHLIEDHLAQVHLHSGGRGVSNHGPQVFQPAAHHHDDANAYKRKHQVLNRRALKNPDDQPAEEAQARDAKQHGEHTHRHRAKNTKPDTPGESPEP